MQRNKRNSEENFVWIAYSDLSTTLMFCFILFLLVFLGTAAEKEKKDQERIKNRPEAEAIIGEMLNAKASLIGDLQHVKSYMQANAGSNGCKDVRWEVDQNGNAIRLFFNSEESWFRDGESSINESGQTCLESFARKWLITLYGNEKNRDQIQNLIIEGHTNSKPPRDKTKDPYLYNLNLSQNRAFSAAQFILAAVKESSFPQDDPIRQDWESFATWERKVLTATGRSSAEVIRTPAGEEDPDLSKRIEFKFTLKHDYEKYEKIESKGN